MKMLNKITIFLIQLVCYTAQAQIQTLWETNHPVGNDSLEVFFYKQDSAGNHYAGGAIGLTFFVSKFDTNGKHQWTVADNMLIDERILSYETQSFVRSGFSDITFYNRLYLIGSKHYQIKSEGKFNFVRVHINRNTWRGTNKIAPHSPMSRNLAPIHANHNINVLKHNKKNITI